MNAFLIEIDGEAPSAKPFSLVRELQSGNAFGYNARSELVEASMGNNAYAYEYDPIGNREWAALNAATNLYAADALNLYGEIQATVGGIPSAPALTPAYDADGNLTALGLWTYAWNAEIKRAQSPRHSHRVTAILRPAQRAGVRSGIPRRNGNCHRLVSACSNNALLVVNTYDHQSRRTRKEVFDTSDNYKLKTINYLWDGWNILRETVADHLSLTTNHCYYTWGPDLSGTIQGAGGVGGLVAVTTVTSDDPRPVLHFPCCDANGNVTEYVAGDGAVAARYAYDAFGNITAQSGPMADAFTHRFSTKPFDAETGLVMFQLRPYDPPTGRFIERDPIQEEGGLNLYGFVGNNVANQFDLLGQETHKSTTRIKVGERLEYDPVRSVFPAKQVYQIIPTYSDYEVTFEYTKKCVCLASGEKQANIRVGPVSGRIVGGPDGRSYSVLIVGVGWSFKLEPSTGGTAQSCKGGSIKTTTLPASPRAPE